jgi:hypothetical protein
VDVSFSNSTNENKYMSKQSFLFHIWGFKN